MMTIGSIQYATTNREEQPREKETYRKKIATSLNWGKEDKGYQ
jgi:hypothetical protein